MAEHDRQESPSRRAILVRPPWSALAVILCIGLIDPVSHFLVMHFPPAGTVPTQGHTVDTFNYLTGMRYAHPPWFSPYVLCSDPYAQGDPTLFAIPHHHLFGAVGTLGAWFHIPPFYMAGFANGLFAAFYLYAVYCFLVLAVPRLADRAFLLFGLGGGLGGLLYVLTWPFGLHGHPEFGRYFLRYFIYELSEGPRFQPWLMTARMYYTLAFGFGFLGLAALVRGIHHGMRRDLALATALFAATTFMNFRAGPMLWGAAALVLLCQTAWPWTRRAGWAAGVLAGILAGGAAALWMVSRNPELVQSVARSQRSALWFSPIVSATFFYWLLIPGTLVRSTQRAPACLRYAGWSAMGYVAAFALLYAAYQAYYGNFLITGEFTVAVIMTDYALLLGLPLGIAVAWWKRPSSTNANPEDHAKSNPDPTNISTVQSSEIRPMGAQASRLPGSYNGPKPHSTIKPSATAPLPTAPPWAALWLLAFFALSFSAWGHGWLLRFTPDRFIIVIGVPLAILGASAIEGGLQRRPRLFRGMQYAIVTCGILSILVTWLVSYGPLGYHTLQRHYSWTRNAFMSQADADTLAHLGEGVVLAPSLGAPLMGDLAVLRGNSTVYGIGSLDYTRHVVTGIRAEVAEFFDPETPDAWRREKAAEWCVRYVYCPDTDPVDAATVVQLRDCGWLEEVAANGKAVLFALE